MFSDQVHSLDWLVSAARRSSHHISVWKIKGLAEVPKGNPNASFWANFTLTNSTQPQQQPPKATTTTTSSSSPLDGGSSGFHCVRLIANCQQFSTQLPQQQQQSPPSSSDLINRRAPARFILYMLTSGGAIECWHCVDKKASLEYQQQQQTGLSQPYYRAATLEVAPQLIPSLHAIAFGHKSPIVASSTPPPMDASLSLKQRGQALQRNNNRLLVHRQLPLLASVDAANRAILWKITEPKVFERISIISCCWCCTV